MRTQSSCNSSHLTEFSILHRYVVLAFAATSISAGLCGCGAKGPAGDAAAPPAMPVQVLVVESQKLTNSTEYLAILKSRHSATINPQVEGQVTKIFVKSGDRVAAGTPLLQIDPLKQEATVNSQESARVAQEANVRLAKVNLDRAVKLQAAGVISKADFDNAQTNYETAVAQLKSLEHQVQQQQVELRYYQVSAPMGGIVGDIPVRVGDRVGVTTLLTTVDEPGALEAYIYVPAKQIQRPATGSAGEAGGRIWNGAGAVGNYVRFAASGYRYTDSAGEGRDRQFQCQTANFAASAGTDRLGNAQRSGCTGACGAANQRRVFPVCRGKGCKGNGGAATGGETRRNCRK